MDIRKIFALLMVFALFGLNGPVFAEEQEGAGTEQSSGADGDKKKGEEEPECD